MGAIRTLLVANRGEVARRVFRTCRELGVRTVAVYTPPDAGAPFVAEADAAVPLDGVRGYLDIDQILAAAEATGADAVHPGWGFLAENASFARAGLAAGLTWVGPPPEAMESMGSKIEARRLMEAAGVPVVPGATLAGSAAPAGADETGVRLPESSGKGTPVGGGGPGEAAIVAAGEQVGFPLLVKASAGGGGKGMRLATRPEDLVAAVADAAREAAAAFGDPAVFLERYVSPGRHVEVQILGDHHGTVVHLFERDCSVQRRHQKLVEEAPSPAVDDDLRARMGQAAVAAAEAVGYHGVGTVEFLLGPDGAFYFLEMNTRLQVEHPVTELVTGLDLVRLQLAVAEGRPLPAEVHAARMSGHAVEVRLYGEDPLHDYQPQTGRVEALEFPAVPGLRLDSGVEAGSVVGTDYDSMLAKVIATGPTRAEAVRLLADALRRARIHGVGTNRDLLVAILEHDEFGAGKADTGFLDRHPPEELLAPALEGSALKLHALAAALASAAAARTAAPVLRPVRSGFRNNPGPPAVRRFLAGGTELTVGYRLDRNPLFAVTAGDADGPDSSGDVVASGDVAPSGVAVPGEGDALPVTLVDARPDAVELVVDGVRRRFDVRRYETSVHVDSGLGSTVLHPVGRFPDKHAERPSGSLVAPMPGTVVKVLAAPGDTVARGDPVVVIEAMKMEHTIGAAGDGTVAEILVEVGRQVDIDQVIAVITTAGDDGPEADPAGG
jgi:acetyl/propionyl-CoA carboxylase alpha subunit